MPMPNPNFLRRLALASATAIVLLAVQAAAQEEVEVAVIDEDEVAEVEAPAEDREIEEITVTARRPGDRRRVDEVYEDPVRAELLRNFYQMQADREESAMRNAAAEENKSRISWGYDPQEEYDMRNQIDMQSLPSERTKPATLFRLRF